MMKCFSFLFSILFCSSLHATDLTFSIRPNKSDAAEISPDTVPSNPAFTVKIAADQPPLIFNTDGDIVDDKGKKVEKLGDKVGSLFVNCTTKGLDDVSFKFFVAGKEQDVFQGKDKDKELKSSNFPDLTGQIIQIKDNTGKTEFLTFKVPGKAGGNKGGGATTKKFSAIDTIRVLFPTLVATTYGLQIPTGNRNTAYTGDKYVHIFLDQYGNNIFSTIPTGISNRQYIVHIFFLQNADNPNEIDYSVNQLEGEFQDALVFNNAGQLSTAFTLKDNPGIVYKWATKEYLLSTSTTNIKFEVVRSSPNKDDAAKIDNVSLKTYTIKMSTVYHGSFDVGLINTTLENPDFSLVASASDPNTKVVKKTGGGNRGVVTAMASFYASPIIILESIFGNKEIPAYKLTGRNFLDDHKIYERIYPTVGVGFTDKTLENLFFGFNWEFARGGAFFAGWHYGKVNTYATGAGFEFEQTPVTDAEFALKQNTAWKTSFAIGLKLDIMIIRNLFGSAAAAPAATGN